MERPKKKEILAYTPNDPDRVYNQALTDYDLWLKEKLSGLESILCEFIPYSADYCIADLASTIRKEFER